MRGLSSTRKVQYSGHLTETGTALRSPPAFGGGRGGSKNEDMEIAGLPIAAMPAVEGKHYAVFGG